MLRFLLLFLLIIHSVDAQILLQGRVISEKDKIPLPAVSISIKGSKLGTLSDSLGNFSIKINAKNTLIFTSIGFEKKEIRVLNLNDFFEIELKESTSNLNEVFVKPPENPAWRIIRNTIKNKDKNDPNQFEKFYAESYSKITVNIDSALAKSKNDSLIRRVSGTVFIIENLSDYFYKKPNRKEIVKATITNVPAFLMPNTFITNELNQIGFYRPFYQFRPFAALATPNEPIDERLYVNPINRDAFDQYDFNLKDTLINESDSTFVIEFKPYKGKKFDGLKGTFYINSDSFALEKVQISPMDSLQVMQFQHTQTYKRFEGKWFPDFISTKVVYILKINGKLNKNLPQQDVNYNFRYDSYFSNVKIGFVPDSIVFDGASRVVLNNADKIDTTTFAKLRAISLSKRENDSYSFGLLKKMPMYKELTTLADKPMRALMMGGLAIGKFQFIITENSINNYEKIRIGLGIQNNLALNPRFKIGGTVALGLGDKALKYSGIIAWHITRNRYNRFEVFYRKDVERPAQVAYLKPNLMILHNQPLVLATNQKVFVDKFTRYGAALHLKPLAWTQLQFFAQNETRIPITYGYIFKEKSSFQTTEIGMNLRYARRENLNRVGDFAESSINQFFPIVYLQINKGINDKRWLGNYDYLKIHGKMIEQIRTKRFGTSIIDLSAGWGKGDIPYPFLFNTLAANTGVLSSFTSSNGFQSMDLNSFAFDKFVSLSYRHNFGKSLIRFKNKNSQPEFSILHKVALFDLSNPEEHLFIPINTNANYFLEAGAEIRNIFRFKFLGLTWGCGVGGSYAYGANARNANLKFNPRVYPIFRPIFL